MQLAQCGCRQGGGMHTHILFCVSAPLGVQSARVCQGYGNALVHTCLFLPSSGVTESRRWRLSLFACARLTPHGTKRRVFRTQQGVVWKCRFLLCQALKPIPPGIIEACAQPLVFPRIVIALGWRPGRPSTHWLDTKPSRTPTLHSCPVCTQSPSDDVKMLVHGFWLF